MGRYLKKSFHVTHGNRLAWLGLALMLSLAITGCGEDSEVTAPKIVAGAEHACAFDADREQVVCWGDNSYGQLGNEAFSAEGRDAPVRVKVVSGRKIKSLAAGHSHTCALIDGADEDVDTDNTVACWGYNHYGQVGDATNNDANIPNFVNGPDGNPLKGVATLTAGAYHTCASMAKDSTYEGKTFCWGRNNMGQIGNGSLVNVNVPTEVKGLEYSGSVAAGTAHTCALTAESIEDAQNSKFQIVCWGDASRGQMRDVQVERGYSTEPVNIGLEVKDIQAIYSEHVVQSDVTTTVDKPVDFDPETAVELTTPAYGQTCAITKNDVLCWGGTNSNGQWGTADEYATEHTVSAEEILSGSEIRAFGAGNAQSCMLVGKGNGTDSNNVACWGFSSSLGFAMPEGVTDAVIADNRNAVSMKGGRPTGLAVGREFVCYAAKGDQPQIWCWGTGKKGQIGNGTTESTRVPVCVKGYCPDTKASDNLVEGQPFEEAPGTIPGVLQIDTGAFNSCAVMTDWTVRCWGWIETKIDPYIHRTEELPSAVDDLDIPVSFVQNSQSEFCALTGDSSVVCWGRATLGWANAALGYSEYYLPRVLPGYKGNVKAIATSRQGLCALMKDDSVKCRLASFTDVALQEFTFPKVANASSISLLEKPFRGPCVLADGTVKCIKDLTNPTYTALDGFENAVTMFDAMNGHFCGVLDNSRVKCRQFAEHAKHIGDEPVYNEVAFQSIQVGMYHACGLTAAGGVKCWGGGGSGQLGDGEGKDQENPVDVQGLQAGVMGLSAGGFHTCAVLFGGRAKCWGNNQMGQLGNGRKAQSNVPVWVDFGGIYGPRDAVADAELREGQAKQKVTVTISALTGDIGYAFDCNGDGSFEINGEVAGHECFYSNLPSGRYNVGYKVTTKGLFGNAEVTGATSFTVRNLPPVVTSVQHDPAVLPAGSNEAKSFTISSVVASDPGGDALTYNYDCNVDGTISGAAEGNKGATNVSCDLSALTPGTYTLVVLVTDADNLTQGNGETRKPITVTIVPPIDTQIDTNPAAYSAVTSPTFTFSSPETDTIEYKLDGAAFAVTTAGMASYTALTDGTHTFYARSVSGGNADASPAIYSWVVDTVAPVTVSDTTFTEPVSTASVTVSFSASDANADGGFTFECRLNSGGWSACLTGQSFTAITEGTHQLTIAATDAAGNATTMPATVSWEYSIPAVPLDPALGPADGTTVSSNGATFEWESGTDTEFECRLDGGSWTTCSSGQNYAGLGDGTHTFEVRAVRNGVPANTTTTRTWTVDTTPPDTLITDSYANDASATSFSVVFGCDDVSCTFECRTDSGTYATCNSPFTSVVSTNGEHSVDVRAYDDLGNVDPSPASVTWTTVFPPSGGGGGSPSAVTSVAAGQLHSCVVTGTGELYCWGDNTYGQLGSMMATGDSPSLIGTNTWLKVASDANGKHSCAIDTNENLYCWGFNASNQIGDGSVNIAFEPTQIGSATWLDVATGANHSCGIQSDGTLWCWGDDFQGSTGLNNGGTIATPMQVGSATNWVTLGLGGAQTCAININGELYCWGGNTWGEVGNGSSGTDVFTPIQIGIDTDWVQVDGGFVHTCAVKMNGTLYCWGSNLDNQNGTGADRSVPTQVGTDVDWGFVTAGSTHTCAIKMTGALWCWGANDLGQLGKDTAGATATPAQIGSSTNWLVVGGGRKHSIAIANDAGTDTVYGWGDNSSWQMGDPTVFSEAYAPTLLTLP